MAGSVLLVGALAGAAGGLLGAVALVGALFVLALARETWVAGGIVELRPEPVGNPWLRGMAVNLLNPHPYLFWLTVGAPTLVAVAAGGILPVAGFLAAFYATLVGSKVALAGAAARAGRRIAGAGYRLAMRILAAILVAFAAALALEGIVALAG